MGRMSYPGARPSPWHTVKMRRRHRVGDWTALRNEAGLKIPVWLATRFPMRYLSLFESEKNEITPQRDLVGRG